MKSRQEKANSIRWPLLSIVAIMALIFDTQPVRIGHAQPFSSNPEIIQGNVIFVNYAVQGQNNGTSWKDAFIDLQSALDIAQSGNEIWVASGTYLPTKRTDAADPRSATYNLIDGVKLYGGFMGSENSLVERKWKENPTILSGDIDLNDDVSPISSVDQIQGDNAYHVVTANGMGAETIVDGFTITAGKTNFSLDTIPCSGDQCGGGLWLNQGDLTLANLVIQGNYGAVGGGIAIIAAGSVSLIETTIQKNDAYNGGGIAIRSSNPLISQTTIAENHAQGAGGGINISSYASPVFTNITVYNNKADWAGGGMYIDATLVSVSHATFYNNASPFANELLAVYGFELKIQNSILWDSSPGNVIGFGYGHYGLTASYNDILRPDGAVFPGEGNINADPRLSVPGNFGGGT